MSAISSPAQIFKTNAPCLEESQLGVFLVNHGDLSYRDLVKEKIESLSISHFPVLLVENPEDTCFPWKERLRNVCWEDPSVLDELEILQKRFDSLKTQVNLLAIPSACIKEKEFAIRQIMTNGEKIKIPFAFKKEQVFQWLQEGNFEKIPLIQQELKKALKTIYKASIVQFSNAHFPKRQTSLLSFLKTHLSQGNVLLICGTSHGNPKAKENEKATQAAEEFLTFIQEAKISYTIYSL